MDHADRTMISRRGFALGMGGLAIAGTAISRTATAAAPATAADVPPAIADLYRKSIVIDALASPNSWNVPMPPPGPLNAGQLENVRKSGITAINLTVGKPGGFEDTVREIAFWLNQIELHPDYFRLVKRHSDIAAAKAEGKMGIIFGFQGMGMIGTDLSLIDTFEQLWVKIMQLTYNDRNALGAGSSLPDSEGLTELGRQAVARLNERNILVDLGHSNARTAMDAVKASTRPITISHNGCRAIYNSQRNQPDEVLRAVAQRGGVVGIYLMPFLGHDPVAASRRLLMRHIEHALQICGEDHVGIGSDQSITPVEITPAYMAVVRKTAEERQKAGIGAPGEADTPVTVPDVNTPLRLEIIANDLAKAGHPTRVIEKVIGGNFNRLFKEIWKA